MEKAVGALRVLQTFWSSNEPQQHDYQGSPQETSVSQASASTDVPAKHQWHQTVKLENDEDEGSVSSEKNPTYGTSDNQVWDDRPTQRYPNLTSQNTDSATTHQASKSPETPQENRLGPVDLIRSNLGYTDLGFAREREADHETRSSPRTPTQSRDHMLCDNIVATVSSEDIPSQLSGKLPDERHDSGKSYATSKVDSGGYSDEEIRSQPDIIFADGTLAMPMDGPQLREIIHRIERDRSLCFKMRWYVARHIRQQYQADLKPSTQHYRRRVYRNHNFTKLPNKSEQLVSLRDKPFNRLDFEAARLQEHFYKDQPGWQIRSISQILQRAYEQYRWNETITDETVDRILVQQADADLRIYANARRLNSPHYDTLSAMPNGGPSRIVEVESPYEASSSSLVGGGADLAQYKLVDSSTQQASQVPSVCLQKAGIDTVRHLSTEPSGETEPSPYKSGSSRNEIEMLRAEICELRAEVEMGKQFRETFMEEQRVSQEALMAEMRMMLEAAECGRKRKRSNDKKQFSRRKSKKLRKYVRKLKELDAQTEGSLSSSSSLAEESPSDSG